METLEQQWSTCHGPGLPVLAFRPFQHRVRLTYPEGRLSRERPTTPRPWGVFKRVSYFALYSLWTDGNSAAAQLRVAGRGPHREAY